jgi:sialidase-1
MKRLALLALLPAVLAAASTPVQRVDVYRARADGYFTYRIPSVIRAADGTLLAFAEARKNSDSDTGDIDLVVKRSRDGGRTWSAQSVIWDDGGNTCGNPCPVVDRRTGTIWLLLTHNLGVDHQRELVHKTARGTRTVWVMRSDDHGASWSRPQEITAAAKDPAWGWYATGPGIGIQLAHGPHAGRLVIPANHSFDDPQGTLRGGKFSHRAHVLYSDDGGKTWRRGGVTGAHTNESQVVELAEPAGALLLDMRSYFNRSRRTHARSTDGGLTWTAPADHPELVEPVCQASILRVRFPESGAPGLLLFSNPPDPKRRVSAYSCLVALDDARAGCLYEHGVKTPYEAISFAMFPLATVR